MNINVIPDKNNKSNEINDFDIWNPPNNDPIPSASKGFVTLLPIKFPTPISVAFLKYDVIEKINYLISPEASNLSGNIIEVGWGNKVL